MRKVVELARALCTEPKLMLLDEPSSGLNVEETDDMAFWIEDIQHELGITVLMVEHDMTLVSQRLGPRAGDEPGQGARRSARRPRCSAHPAVIEAYLGAADDVSTLRRVAAEVGAMSVLKLLNVESAYGPVRAIRGVSLAVEQGRIVTVLGANGAGKSTILKTISGIIDPRKGRSSSPARTSRPATRPRSCARGLSHVPEGREVFPLLSVRRQPADGRLHAQRPRRASARDMETVYGYFPILRERAQAGGRAALRRAAADAQRSRAR